MSGAGVGPGERCVLTSFYRYKRVIIHPLKEDDFETMQYMQRAALMSRHIPLGYPPPTEPTSKLLPIIEIIVGPGRHKEVSKISVGDLIRTYRYPEGACKLTCSEIPFQGV